MTRASRVTVKATTALLIPAEADGVRAILRNKGSKACDLGPKATKSGEGYQLATTDAPLEVTLDPGESLYGICAEGEETTIHVLKVGAK